jgi:hypothetical protein
LTSLLESGRRKEVAKMWLAVRDRGDEVVVVLEKQPLKDAYEAYRKGLLEEAGLIINYMGAGVFLGASAFEGLITFKEGDDLDFLKFPFKEGKASLMLGFQLPEELGPETMPVGVLTAGKRGWEADILLVRDSWF